jgi:CheY-like chemotaxis protein
MAKPDHRATPCEPEARRGRILIVDDEEVIASTLTEFLQGERFDVAVAQGLISALEQVEAFEPEIVLCDVQLPGADALQARHCT